MRLPVTIAPYAGLQNRLGEAAGFAKSRTSPPRPNSAARAFSPSELKSSTEFLAKKKGDANVMRPTWKRDIVSAPHQYWRSAGISFSDGRRGRHHHRRRAKIRHHHRRATVHRHRRGCWAPNDYRRRLEPICRRHNSERVRHRSWALDRHHSPDNRRGRRTGSRKSAASQSAASC